MNNTTPLPLVIVSHQLPEAWLAKLHGRCRIITGPPTTVEAGLSADRPALEALAHDRGPMASEVRLLARRLRSGELDLRRLELAAWVGHAPSARASCASRAGAVALTARAASDSVCARSTAV